MAKDGRTFDILSSGGRGGTHRELWAATLAPQNRQLPDIPCRGCLLVAKHLTVPAPGPEEDGIAASFFLNNNTGSYSLLNAFPIYFFPICVPVTNLNQIRIIWQLAGIDVGALWWL